ncbi:MAG: glycosyltransferase family 2 protein [Desulfovibrio sp.]|nr:glycosyltransferase family 2 protein [Desulfovibrio sp.]
MVSIIIPVYNAWSFTEQCLVSLANATCDDVFEVIVVDNASTDMTPSLCQAKGKELFSDRFFYLRQNENRNYSGANNIGVRHASGESILLLNNDTIVQDGWLQPLRSALESDQNRGAVGPLLLYPPDAEGMKRVQHAGVTVSLGKQVSHLYEFFPYPHPLLEKERTLQIITGAALFMPRRLYLELGGLDERFVNGFEDVEFCVRLRRHGYNLCVIPESVIFHYGGQSAGRNRCEQDNSALCKALCANDLHIDEPRLFREDGYDPFLSPWLTLEAHLSPKRMLALSLMARGGLSALKKAVLNEPYWIDGAMALARQQEACGALKDAFETWLHASRLRATPEVLIPFAHFLKKHTQNEALASVQEMLHSFRITKENRLHELDIIQTEMRSADEERLAAKAEKMKKENDHFFATDYAALEACLELSTTSS